MERPLAVRCDGLCKHYKHFQLRDVDLSLEQGTVMGLVGPNGAGKSTVIRMTMGMLTPDAGTVTVLGHPMPKEQAQAKFQIGFVAEDMRLYESETLGFHIDFVRSIFDSWDDAYARALLKRLDLVRDQKVKGFSHGQRVKSILLLALARRPRLLVFDEPTTGLDPAVRKEVLDEMQAARNDETRSILFSSHNTLDIEQLSDHITFIYGGSIVESKDKDTFLNDWRRLRVRNVHDRSMPDWENVRDFQQVDQFYDVTMTAYHDGIPSQFAAAGLTVESVETMTLEEIFLSNVRHAKKSQTPELVL